MSIDYDFWSYDKELMKDFNWFLKKNLEMANIRHGFVKDTNSYRNVNRHGDIDLGLGDNVEYFSPSITQDDRMRYIGTVIADADMSVNNIICNTIISHFYGARGVHQALTLKEDSNNCFVDFDKIGNNDEVYIKEIRTNIEKAKEAKLKFWGTTELHTPIITAGRNYCRKKYNNPDREFQTFDVCEWVASFKETGIIDAMLESDHLKDTYKMLRTQPGIGEYYGFHCSTSTSALPFMKYHHDQRFVAPGPGAKYTIKRLWPDIPNKLMADAVYFLRENQLECGLTENVEFHPDSFNIKRSSGEFLFAENQDCLKYYGTEVLACQFGVYLQIRDDEKACARRKVARLDNIAEQIKEIKSKIENPLGFLFE